MQGGEFQTMYDTLEALDQVLSRVDGGQLGAPEAIAAVLDAQVNLRNNRRLLAARGAAGCRR